MRALKVIIFVFIHLFMLSTLQAQDKPLENISIQLKWFYQYQFAGVFMAKEKGFYKEIGLDVNLKEFKFRMDTSKEVLYNKASFATGRSTIILDRLQRR